MSLVPFIALLKDAAICFSLVGLMVMLMIMLISGWRHGVSAKILRSGLPAMVLHHMGILITSDGYVFHYRKEDQRWEAGEDGNLDLTGCPLVVTLPPGLRVSGSLRLVRCTILSLPPRLRVSDRLNLGGVQGMIYLPKDIQILGGVTGPPGDTHWTRREITAKQLSYLEESTSNLSMRASHWEGGSWMSACVAMWELEDRSYNDG